VSDAHEAFGQHVEEESHQELGNMESHFFLYAAVRIVLPTKADLFSVEGKQTAIRDGDTMCVAAQISEHLNGPAERSFGVNHPAPQMETPEQLGKLFRIGKQGRRSAAAEFAELTRGTERS